MKNLNLPAFVERVSVYIFAAMCLLVSIGAHAGVTVTGEPECTVPDRNVTIVDNTITITYDSRK